jgi:hypothetical protein
MNKWARESTRWRSIYTHMKKVVGTTGSTATNIADHLIGHTKLNDLNKGISFEELKGLLPILPPKMRIKFLPNEEEVEPDVRIKGSVLPRYISELGPPEDGPMATTAIIPTNGARITITTPKNPIKIK